MASVHPSLHLEGIQIYLQHSLTNFHLWMDNLEVLLLATTLQHFMQQERLLLRQSHQKKLKEPYENRQDHLAIFIK